MRQVRWSPVYKIVWKRISWTAEFWVAESDWRWA